MLISIKQASCCLECQNGLVHQKLGPPEGSEGKFGLSSLGSVRGDGVSEGRHGQRIVRKVDQEVQEEHDSET